MLQDNMMASLRGGDVQSMNVYLTQILYEMRNLDSPVFNYQNLYQKSPSLDDLVEKAVAEDFCNRRIGKK